MIRYKKLGYVELNVTDLKRARPFYEDIVGLQFVERGARGELYYRCTEDPYAVVLHEAESPGLKRVGWMLESESQFEAVFRQLRDHRIAYETLTEGECSSRQLGNACRFVEPNSAVTHELYVLRPDYQPSPFVPTLAKIQRLGHVLFSTPKAAEASAFFRDVLNFRESDRVADDVFIFLRPFPSRYHHGLGLGRSDRYRFLHLNFMVSEIDDIGRALHRFRQNDIPIVWGPGRHPVSESVFLYFLEPDGLTLEYSYGMEEFDETGCRGPRNLEPGPRIGDVWGAPVDPRCFAVGSIERYEVPAS